MGVCQRIPIQPLWNDGILLCGFVVYDLAFSKRFSISDLRQSIEMPRLSICLATSGMVSSMNSSRFMFMMVCLAPSLTK